jgi:membrane protease subunit HflK
MLDLLIILIIAGFFVWKNLGSIKKNKNNSSWNHGEKKENFFANDDFKRKMNNFFNFSSRDSNSNENINSQDNKIVGLKLNQLKPERLFFGILFIAIFAWFLSGFYIIQPDEEGVETFLGKYSKTSPSGLHYRIPSPITKIYKVKVTRINTEEIGYRASSSGFDESLVLIESSMITKDENLIDVNFDVQWRIIDAAKFIFNIKFIDISSTIRFASESVMRDLIGRNNMSFALGEGRALLAEQARMALQKLLDEYDLGISILSIPIKKIDPPKQVIDSFRDVQSARADKEREINMALAYKNDVIPRARGEAAKIINEAEAYYYSVLNNAKGETAKMMSLYPLYKQNKEFVKVKLYTELLEDVFSGMNKVILPPSVGGSGSNQLNFLNLGEIFKNIEKK